VLLLPAGVMCGEEEDQQPVVVTETVVAETAVAETANISLQKRLSPCLEPFGFLVFVPSMTCIVFVVNE